MKLYGYNVSQYVARNTLLMTQVIEEGKLFMTVSRLIDSTIALL